MVGDIDRGGDTQSGSKADGQFAVVWKTPGLVAGDAWSKELPDSKDLIGDWVGKKCGNYNTKTN